MTITMRDDLEPEANFPVQKLMALEEKISHQRWVVPVLPDQELDALLIAATNLAETGEDLHSRGCQRFYEEALNLSFTKILTDEAVTSWKGNIQQCVRANCERLVRLCALKMDDPRLLQLLATVFNPHNKFHSFNASRQSESLPGAGAGSTRNSGSSLSISGPQQGTSTTPEPSTTETSANQTLEDSSGPPGDASPSEHDPASETVETLPAPSIPTEIFARPSYHRTLKGWLVDLINLFGQCGGFQSLLDRFQMLVDSCSTVPKEAGRPPDKVRSIDRLTDSNGPHDSTFAGGESRSASPAVHQTSSSRTAIAAAWDLLNPFGMCTPLLSQHTINTYFKPILDIIPILLEQLSDEELKKACGLEGRNDHISSLMKAAKCLAGRLAEEQQHIVVKGLELFRLNMVLRLMKMPSFNSKMAALNEINQIIGTVTQQLKPDWLSPAYMAAWIRENHVLEIVLHSPLHQTQYVERLEKMLRFMIKEEALTLDDLELLWLVQQGKHETIVKNLHDLLAKLAWDFNPDQLHHLFDCFKASWSTSNKKQSDKLLEVIRRIAEDDKDGMMAHKVLELFWNLAHSQDVCNDSMDMALANHLKILEYSCIPNKDAQKMLWLDKCVEELNRSDHWALPALKHMRDICCLHPPTTQGAPGPSGGPQSPHGGTIQYRQEVIERLQSEHMLVIRVTDSLTAYMAKVHTIVRDNPALMWSGWLPDGRYSHSLQINERLSFLRFLLKDGQLWLCAEQAKQIWVCLAENPASPSDREACFRWFSKLMGEEPDLDPGINLHFFRENILTLDPKYLTHSGIKCFERFFKAVNIKEGKLKIKRRRYVMDDSDLIGLDYLWTVIMDCNDDLAMRGIELLRETAAAPGPHRSPPAHHEAFLTACFLRMRTLQEGFREDNENKVNTCLVQMVRVLRVLQEYVLECDRRYQHERQILPTFRAARGRHCGIKIKFQVAQRQLDDMEVGTHSNETLHSLKSTIQKRLKCNSGSGIKLELFSCKNEIFDINCDRKLLSQIPIRDKATLMGKVTVGSTSGQSSNDSSSESSTDSPPPTIMPETYLPGVLMSRGQEYIPYILSLVHLGMGMNNGALRDAAHTLIQVVPPHLNTVERLTDALMSEDDAALKEMLYKPPPPTIAYNLQVLYTMVMPALDPLSSQWRIIQLAAVRRAPLLVHTLIDKTFLERGSTETQRVGVLSLLKLNKLVLTAIGHLVALLTLQNTQGNVIDNRNVTEILCEALQTVCSELMVKAVSEKLAQAMQDEMLGSGLATVEKLLSWCVPTQRLIRAAGELSLTSAIPSNNKQKTTSMNGELLVPVGAKQDPELHMDDVSRVRECLEVMAVCVALGGDSVESLMKEDWWQELVIQLLVLCPDQQVRISCAENILAMCSWGTLQSPPHSPLAGSSDGNHQKEESIAAEAALPILLSMAENAVGTPGARNAQELLQLVCQLMALAGPRASIPLLPRQVERLRTAASAGYEIDDVLLEGHLNIAKEIFIHSSNEVKLQYGAHAEGNQNLIKEVACTFLFPYSWAWRCMSLRKGASDAGLCEQQQPERAPVCCGPGSSNAACDLLVALSQRCAPNMRMLADLLIEIFYSDSASQPTDWEFYPVVGSRAPSGLVGLKNAGSTCYMNSVLQQLYMVPEIRDALLTVQGAATDPNEDFSGEETLSSGDATPESAEDYNVCILKQVQAIFAHLHYTRQQFYIPRGLWMHFKLQGEPVNLREQQDAVEFFMSLVESLDEALKALGHEQLMAKTLGGSFSDQKICKGCPHRYCKEEPFSVVSLDIRNLSRLQESFEAYVRGELLEGADAYHCDKCNEKVVTVKRLVLNKLPPVLAIQLKRFEYDFEKVCAIKFNDYFEFPRDLDVEPYTVWGLAKAEGDSSSLWEGRGGASAAEETSPNAPPETKYSLTGIVVHSGQASGGHYYSYIMHRDKNGIFRWLKFDDGEVSECAMGDDEEMKAQCFGGDYMGERQSYRLQKRWWNAYMLFYTRTDILDARMLTQPMNNLSLKDLSLPSPIWQSVRRGNIAFNHRFEVFSEEHFNLLRRLCSAKIAPPIQLKSEHVQKSHWPNEQENLRMTTTQLATKFLFQVCLKTKKSLRGPLNEWYDILVQRLRYSSQCRSWFALYALLSRPRRMADYLLHCPANDVRNIFVKILVMLAHYAQNDPPLIAQYVQPSPAHRSLSDQLLAMCLSLAVVSTPTTSIQMSSLSPEQQQTMRQNMPLLFNLFHSYAMIGAAERHQLLKLHCLHAVLYSCMDDSNQTPIKHQYPEMLKMHQLVSMLTRCCDLSGHGQYSSSGSSVPPLPYPYGKDSVPLVPITQPCANILYGKNSYIKRLMEESSGSDEVICLVQYLSWENPSWSRAVLAELLWQMTYAYYQELRHHVDTLTALLSMEDSWQTHRIHNVIKGTGMVSERDGLLDTAARSRNHHERRAYTCIKLVTIAASRWPQAARLLREQPSVRRRWRLVRAWLRDCLEKRRAATQRAWSPSGTGGNNVAQAPPIATVPPNASNETSAGYYLERTNSARRILDRAYQISPEDDDDTEGSDVGSDSELCADTGTATPSVSSRIAVEGPTSSRKIQVKPKSNREECSTSTDDHTNTSQECLVNTSQERDKSSSAQCSRDCAPSRPSSPTEPTTVTKSKSTVTTPNYAVSNVSTDSIDFTEYKWK